MARTHLYGSLATAIAWSSGCPGTDRSDSAGASTSGEAAGTAMGATTAGDPETEVSSDDAQVSDEESGLSGESGGETAGETGTETCFDGVPVLPAPLAMLPSCAGPHVAEIEAMAPGQWLNLGQPAADPEFDRARGRAWTARMPAAEALGGAFLYGEGVHGWWDERTGYFMDDLWFYDLLAHRWICLYPGTSVTNPPNLSLNADGFIAHPDGMFQPVATAIHGWSFVTYDSDQRRFLSTTASRGEYYAGALQPWLVELAEDPARNTTNRSPWSYDVDTGRFDRKPTASVTPVADVNVYLAGEGRMFAWSNRGGNSGSASFYDAEANDWSSVDARGPAVPFGWDAHGVHDPSRERVYLYGSPLGNALVQGDNALWIYDLARDQWIDPQPSGTRPPTGIGTWGSLLHYDVAEDALLLFHYLTPADSTSPRQIYRYAPGDNEWTVLGGFPGEPDAPTEGWQGVASGFYNAALDVHVFFRATDSGKDPGVVWVYRA